MKTTVSQYAEAHSISKPTARKLLEARVAAGTATRRSITLAIPRNIGGQQRVGTTAAYEYTLKD